MTFIKLEDRRAAIAVLVLVAAVAATYLAYRPGLGGPLILDDYAHLVPIIEESGADPAYLWSKFGKSSSGPLGRPVAMNSFLADAVAYGPDIASWKRTNVLLHLVTGLLVAWFAYLVVTASGRREAGSAWAIASVLAGVWLLHPLHVSTVLYLVQRMTELSTLFVVAGLVCYMRGRMQQIRHGSGGWASILVAFSVFLPLSLLSKESGLLLPLYCAIAEWVLFRFDGPPRTRKIVSSSFLAVLIAHVAAGVYLLANFSSMVLDSYQVRDFTFLERVLTQPRVIVMYLGQLLVPSQQKMGFFHDDFPVSSSLTDPAVTIPSMVLIAALVASAIVVRKRIPLYAFGILLFFASHLMESSVFALELAFEHRNYLGACGLFLAVYGLLDHFVTDRKWLPVAAAIGLLLPGFLLTQRIQTWTSTPAMFQYVYFAHPQSPRLNELAADMDLAAGRFDLAREKLFLFNNDLASDLYRLRIDCREFGSISDEAIDQVAVSGSQYISGLVMSTVEAIAQEVSDSECKASTEALARLLDRVFSLRARSIVDRQTILIAKARLLETSGETDKAVEVLAIAHELRPDDALPLYIAARALTRVGRIGEAAAILMQASEIERQSLNVYEQLSSEIYRVVGGELMRHGQDADAADVFAAAAAINPGTLDFRLLLVDALLKAGHVDAASTELAALDSYPEAEIVEHRRTIASLKARIQAGSWRSESGSGRVPGS